MTVLAAAADAYACPDIDGLVDLNCDQQLVIVAFGDSITYGRGDSLNIGGYPGRLKYMLPHAAVYNLGKPGEDSYRGRSRAAQLFPAFSSADYFVVLEGVNDFWVSGHSTGSTLSNLLRINQYAANTGALTLLANLTAIKRSNQQSWVYSVNVQLRPYKQIDFYALGERIISGDLIHPSASGYDQMASLVYSSFQFAGQLHRPLDGDADGIYDFAEARFGTSPYLTDSDNDGVSDGNEVFVYGSNPLVLDTDNDGFDDGFEVNTLGSDPVDPRPSAPVLTEIEVIQP